MIKSKDFGLLVALGVLAFLAIASPKKVLVAEGFAFTRDELDQGSDIYGTFCASCHDRGRTGAPRTGHAKEWEKRLARGMGELLLHAVEGYRGTRGYMPPKGGHSSLSPREVGLATAWMVRRSTPGEEAIGP